MDVVNELAAGLSMFIWFYILKEDLLNLLDLWETGKVKIER